MANLRGNVHDMIVDQGATVNTVFTIKNSARSALDITGYVARMQVRRFDGTTRDPSPTIIAEYTSYDGYLIIGDTAGTVTLLIPPAEMAAYEPGSYVYDLEVESSLGETTRIVQGKFIVRAEVTR
jgi:hypothetical protein